MDIKYVTFEDLKNNYSLYSNTRVIISDCPFCFYSNSINKYYLEIGPRGGCKVFFPDGSSKTISSDAITRSRSKTGLMVYGNNGLRMQFPYTHKLRERVARLIKEQMESREYHERLLKKAKESIANTTAMLSDNPELLI